MKYGIVIPAYNAEATLEEVVDRIPEVPGAQLARVVIVNDGSRDRTGAVAQKIASTRPDVDLVHHVRNSGYGAAMKTGLATLRAVGGLDAAACIHADGQYAPEVLGVLLEKLSGGRGADLVQGSRLASGTALSGGMPLYKYLAGRILTAIENRAFGLDMTDYHSGYLVYGPRALRELPLHRLCDSFDFDVEIIASARARGMRIVEHPIPTRYGDEESHLRPIIYGFRVLGVVGRYLMGHYGPSMNRPDDVS